MVKKFLSAAFGAGMLLATAAPALATSDCDLNTTGPFSRNKCDIKAPKTAVYLQKNRALVVKLQTSSSNSGGNNQNYNTNVSGGGVSTSEATGALLDQTDVNSSLVGVDQSAGGGPGTGSISTSGPFSDNEVKIENAKTALVTVDNNAFVMQVQKSSANSGNNSMSFNTVTSGSINTGPATSNLESNTFVNYTEVQITQ